MSDKIDMHGRLILVTGASSGIGKATALMLSKAGAKIAAVARNEEKLSSVIQECQGSGHKYYTWDLKNIGNIENLVEKITEENGRLDGLVHCAGVSSMRPLMNTCYDFLHDMFLINFYAFMELVRVYAKKKNNKGGAIVGISSVASVKGVTGRIAYCASKGAMDSAIRPISLEIAKKNIRINTIRPGLIKTEMHSEYVAVAGENAVDNVVSITQPLGLGSPSDVANLAVYLLSDAASFITGSSFAVDGGYLA